MQRRIAAAHRAFTLIEILVVVVILAVLAAVVVPNVLSRVGDARVSAAISDIKTFETNLDLYHLDTNAYPPNLQALIDKQDTKGWNGPYIKNQDKIQNDPWGHPYAYKAPGDNGREYEVVSPGPDGQTGTADDIQSFNLKKN